MNHTLEDGIYYKKKGQILSINTNNHTLQLSMLDSNDLLQLDVHDVETVIPNMGKRVMILNGKFSGEIGSIQQLDMNQMTCDIQLTKSSEIVRGLSLDHVSKYMESS